MTDFDNTPGRLPPHLRAFVYTANALALIGLLLFLSTFFSGALHFGDFTDFENRTRSMAFRAVLGMTLMIVGGIVHGVARSRGAGASNQTGEPQQWESQSSEFPPPPVQVRCRACRALNDERAKFCDQCGAEL